MAKKASFDFCEKQVLLRRRNKRIGRNFQKRKAREEIEFAGSHLDNLSGWLFVLPVKCYNKTMRISFKRIAIIFLIGLFGFLNFFNFQAQAADDAGDIQSDINKLQKKAEQIQQDLNASQGLLQKTTSQVVTTQSLIQKTASEISRKEAEVKNLPIINYFF